MSGSKEFGQAVAWVRRKYWRLPQPKMARMMGYSPGHLEGVEQGVRTPSPRFVASWVNMLACPREERERWLQMAEAARAARRKSTLNETESGAMIRRERERKCMTIAELSAISGYCQGAISSLETGRRAGSRAFIRDISQALGLGKRATKILADLAETERMTRRRRR